MTNLSLSGRALSGRSFSGASISLMKRTRLVLPVSVLLLLAACGAADNPQLASCQGITGKLAGEVADWPKTDAKESGSRLIVSGHYTLASGGTGDVTCVFQRDNTGSSDRQGPFHTSPQQVTLNGRKIGTRELLGAAFKSTKDQLGEISKETARQGKLLVDDVTEKAEDLTQQAETAIKSVEGQVGEAAAALSEQAQRVAEETAEGVKKALE